MSATNADESIISAEQLQEALRGIPNPAGEGNLLDAGKVRYFEINGSLIRVEVEGNNPALHARQKLAAQVKVAVSRVTGGRPHKTEVTVHVDPSPTLTKKEDRLLQARHIIAVASGKGGVGKSTVAANLAVALSLEGHTVGLVDADIYGPSVPTMFDVENRRPDVRKIDDKPYIMPVENHGVKMLSIGFFAGLNQAVAWRGPMASKALRQMFADAWWGALDYMVVDLPPGTGDIHLTLVQTLPLTGAIVVTTPQKVALTDARKAIAMFRMPAVNVPVLGLVENMAWFSPPLHPEERYYIFGRGGGEALAKELEVPLLGSIPLVEDVCAQADAGKPIVLNASHPMAPAYRTLARNVVKSLSLKSAGEASQR